MRVRFLILLFVLSFSLSAQTIRADQQKALTSYLEYANKSGAEVTAVFQSVKSYYEDLQTYRTSKYKRVIRFACPVQLEDYYYNNALAATGLGTEGTALKVKLQALRKAAEEIDLNCKALDTYHKLEDYKTDDYKKAEQLIDQFQALLTNYRNKRTVLGLAVQATYLKLQPSATNMYATVIKQMQERMAHEKEILDSWSYNLHGQTHTGWPVESLKEHILKSDALIKKSISQTGIAYPASSMIPSFTEGLTMLQQTKRNALDGYTFEAQQSDAHSNRAYLDLINVYNGVLIAFYNSFVKYAQPNYNAMLALEYAPLFEIRTQERSIENKIEPFVDIPHALLTVTSLTTPISPTVFKALSNYVDYINECVRQTDHLQRLYVNLDGSTSYYRGLTTFQGKGGLTFNHQDFEIPFSYLQKTIAESTVVSEKYRKSLNDQAEVLHRILTEMNQLSIELTGEIAQKNYEKDNLKRVDEIIDRYKLISDLFHEKNETLYSDVRKIFESYKIADPNNSWNVSGKALLQLTDADKKELFRAKAFYLGDSTLTPDTDEIQKLIRDVIANEYTNLKGIEKIGRNNGNCPYTPYEDLPNDSKKFTEPTYKAATVSAGSYSHPYHNYVYMYNDVVRDYNKFCELSKVPLLQTIHEPELFVREKGRPKQKASDVPPTPKPLTVAQKPEPGLNPPVIPTTSDKTKTLRDTIYIETHDTVYLDRPNEDIRSMEGYATNNLVLMIDVSGSMNQPDKLPLLKTSILELVSMMREEDEVSVVVFSGKPKILLEPVSCKEKEKIKKAIEKLSSKGTTDGNSAIAMAYEVADKNYLRGGNNRIILATDGEFPIAQKTRDLIEKFSKEDIFLSVFNFGVSQASSKNLEAITSLGKGNYEHVTRQNIDTKLIREAKSKRKK